MLVCEVSSVSASTFQPFIARMGAKQISWSVEGVNGQPGFTLHSLNRVVVLDENKVQNSKQFLIVNAHGDDLRMGYVSAEAVEAKSLASVQVSRSEQTAAFLEDAELILNLAAIPTAMQSFTPEFGRLVQTLRQKILRIKTLPSGFIQQVRRVWKIDLANKPETLERYQQLIFQTLNPRGTKETLAESTLFIPLSVEWFQSDKTLGRYFDQNWVHGSFDTKLFGSSGEGLDRDGQAGEFVAMAGRFLALKSWIESNDPSRMADPEFQWLQKFSNLDLSTLDRFIFIHDQTWKTAKLGQEWQDYIPVDQSFGLIQNPALLSVAIHEINVNSSDPYFLPGDTHSPREDSVKWWQRLQKEKTWTPPLDPAERAEEISKIMGISPRLGTVVLAVILTQF